MVFIPEFFAGSVTYVPICMNCICASCEEAGNGCERCSGDTTDGTCCLSVCEKEDIYVMTDP